MVVRIRFMTEISGLEPTARGLSAREFAELVDDCWSLTAGEPSEHADPKAEQAALIDEVRFWEELKAVAAARQARATVSFAKLRRAMPRPVPGSDDAPKRSINAEIALARRDSPASGSRHVGVAKALVEEMPNTMAALESGELTEWRATIVVRETACLSREDRVTVDAELGARPGGTAKLSNRELAAEAKRIAYRLDLHSVVRRARKAEAERGVTIRPAPDTMSYVTALLPVQRGVAVFKALSEAADAHRSQHAEGDDRTRGQVMADTLVERVTGQASAPAVPIEVSVVISDDALFDTGEGDACDEPADVVGYGPVPADLLREWLQAEAPAWLRRVYTRPGDGALVAMDSHRRRFEGKLRDFVTLRDRVCRTPWCGAPIRHVDHPVAVARGGGTSAANAQGLCEACNYVKEEPGWQTSVADDGAVVTTTPTGHTYETRPPLAARRNRAENGQGPPVLSAAG
jgi:hypothetical protein